MLLRRRAPGIQTRPLETAEAYAHLDPGAIAVLRCLTANGVDFVLVGAVAEAVRSEAATPGPVAIVPAPYRRNLARLERALAAARARQRFEGTTSGEPETLPVNLTAEKLARGARWTLRLDRDLDLDLEPLPSGDDEAPGYRELLFETTRCTLAHDVTVEVASPEDIARLRARAAASRPRLRISRAAAVVHEAS